MAFIANLMIAAWIKFNRDSARGWITPLVATVTLALGMLGMLKSITLWASHLFEPRSSAAAIALDAVARGVATHDTAGLPFDWHRLPCTSCSAPHYMPCGQCKEACASLQVRYTACLCSQRFAATCFCEALVRAIRPSLWHAWCAVHVCQLHACQAALRRNDSVSHVSSCVHMQPPDEFADAASKSSAGTAEHARASPSEASRHLRHDDEVRIDMRSTSASSKLHVPVATESGLRALQAEVDDAARIVSHHSGDTDSGRKGNGRVSRALSAWGSRARTRSL